MILRLYILLIWDTKKNKKYMAIRMVLVKYLVALALVL